RQSFSIAVFDLIHGSGTSEDRLRAYLNYVERNGLPSKWTFPTYFLFLFHPQTEIYVKPRMARWFLEFCDAGFPLTSSPSAQTYAQYQHLSLSLMSHLH